MTLQVEISHRIGSLALDVAFAAAPGVTALFGPSGAGKSTVLNIVAGLIRAEKARILLEGREIGRLAPHRRRIAMVFQEPRLFPHLKVRGNLAYGQRFARPDGPGLAQVVDLLGLGPLLDRAPATLSGGEAQRVAIGRALLSHPQALLLDEPLSALDAPRKAEILPWIERLVAETALPVVLVTHAMAEVTRLASQMVVIEGGQMRAKGRLEDVLSDPDLVGLLGVTEAGAVITATVVEQAPDGLARLATEGGDLHLAVAAPIGARLRLRLDAGDILLSHHRPSGLTALNILEVRILRLVRIGGQVVLQLGAGETRFLARITTRSAEALDLQPGDRVHAILKTMALARG
jgi:molybdate transport system ATP-binding protein